MRNLPLYPTHSPLWKFHICLFLSVSVCFANRFTWAFSLRFHMYVLKRVLFVFLFSDLLVSV